MARVRPLAAMSRFIGSTKAECANNCQRRREAKPPHVQIQIGEKGASEGPPGHKEPIILPCVMQHLCAHTAPRWGVCKGSVSGVLAHGAQDTLLNPIRAFPEDTRLPVTVSQHQALTAGRRNAF